MHPRNNPKEAALLLRGAAVLFGVMGLAICAWLADKAIRYPFIRASQFGYDAPLWTPMIVFIAVCTTAVVLLFVRAARRMTIDE